MSDRDYTGSTVLMKSLTRICANTSQVNDMNKSHLEEGTLRIWRQIKHSIECIMVFLTKIYLLRSINDCIIGLTNCNLNQTNSSSNYKARISIVIIVT